MLKKAGLIVSAAVGLSLLAAPIASADPIDVPDRPTFGDAAEWWMNGGGALGFGAASLIAGAYTGIALTPGLVADSLLNDCGGGC